MIIFIDTDVLLDVLMERKEFSHSQQVLSLVEQKKLHAYTSPLIFTNSFYIIAKLKNKQKAWIALKKIRLLLNVSAVTENIIDLALASEFTDFEDAVHYYTALQQNVEYIVTRNKKDYVTVQIPVVTPQELLAIRNV